MVKALGWVRDRWIEHLEPVLRTVTVAQEKELRTLWEQELQWWKSERHLSGDSLRNPITQVRALISQIPLTDENSYERNGRREHIGLRCFNLAEGEWVAMNDRSRATTQERLDEVRLVSDPEGIVHRAMALLLSDDWAELVVGIAMCTGRRLAEILKTAVLTQKEPYTVWFEGQIKGRTRIEERYEIPILVRAYLVIEAVKKLRRLVDCTELEVAQVSQKYGKGVNDAVERIYADKVEKRGDRDRITAHTLRNLYAAVAVLWFCPDRVSDVNYKAYIHGHRFILAPDVEPETSAEEVEQVRLNYASHANYDDYKIADGEGKLDGRHGIKLGLPGVSVLDYFRKDLPVDVISQPQVKARRKRTPKKKEDNKTGYSTMKPSVETKAWVDDERAKLSEHLHHEVKDDEFIRRMLVSYIAGGEGGRSNGSAELTLDTLDLTPAQRDLFRQALAISGSTDLLSFLLAAGEREARSLVSNARRHDTARYAAIATSKLAAIKIPEASQERFRRAVYAIMEWNKAHDKQPLQQWYITTLSIQNLVGGRKEAIKEYQEAMREEIEEHHQELDIHANFNRKPVSIREMITVPEEPEKYPWGRPAEAVPFFTRDLTVTS
jgi:uncharacterized protein (DUF1778 family)